jgi:putative ABC transport system permease protein
MRALLARMLGWFRRGQADRELSEEMDAHLDFATADHIARGLSPEAARRAARLKFGGTLQTKEAYRDRQGWPLLEHLIQDLRYAIRVLAKRPILLAATTLSIGVGVGINVAVYSVVRTVLFKPGLTAAVPDDLFRIAPGLSYPNYVDVRAHEAFAGLAAMQASTLTYRTGDATATIGARVVSDNFFEVLGLHALYGRTFGSTDGVETIKDSNVVVISYAFWQRLGGDQAVLGRTISLNGWPYVVAGVLPKGVYSMIGPLVSPSVYVPLGPRVNRGLDARNAAQFDLVGRLRTGMTRTQVSAALALLAQDLERQFPNANSGLRRTLSVAPLQDVGAQLEGPAGRVALTLAGALFAVVGLVLLVACANVAGLLLARTAERTREISIRIALGATRGRILQQFLAESVAVATLGCGAGAALWTAVMTALPKTALIVNSGIDLIPAPASVAQCGLLVVIVSLACGIGPALSARQVTPRAGLHPSPSGISLRRWNLRQSLVVGQVGVSFILLVGGCALLLSLMRQEFADPGFDISHILSIQMRLPTTSNGPDFFALRDALGALPGVTSVASGDLPVGLIAFDSVRKVGATDDAGFPVQVHRVGPRYLTTLGIHLLRGRDLRDDDVRDTSASAMPVVVGETFARRYFGSVDVIDQQVVLPRDPENGREARRLVIVGVSQDGAVQVFGGERIPVLYFPALSSSLVIRVAGSAAGAVRTLERTVAALEPGAAVTVAPMAERLSFVLLPVRVATIFLSALGGVGLLLAMTGLYAVVSYAATRRRFEMGLRIALGASRSAIMQLMLREAVLIVCVGSVAGAGLSFVLIRAIWPLLLGDQGSLTPLALLAVFLLVLAVGIAAALRPALGAASVEPMLALRQE